MNKNLKKKLCLLSFVLIQNFQRLQKNSIFIFESCTCEYCTPMYYIIYRRTILNHFQMFPVPCLWQFVQLSCFNRTFNENLFKLFIWTICNSEQVSILVANSFFFSGSFLPLHTINYMNISSNGFIDTRYSIKINRFNLKEDMNHFINIVSNVC